MKRELDLVRAILLDVEGLPVGNSTSSIEVDGYSQDIIAEHVRLLQESGYIEADIRISPNSKGNPQVDLYIVTRLLSEGHDFVADIRNKAVWEKVKTAVSANSESVSLATWKAIAAKMASEGFSSLFGP